MFILMFNFVAWVSPLQSPFQPVWEASDARRRSNLCSLTDWRVTFENVLHRKGHEDFCVTVLVVRLYARLDYWIHVSHNRSILEQLRSCNQRKIQEIFKSSWLTFTSLMEWKIISTALVLYTAQILRELKGDLGEHLLFGHSVRPQNRSQAVCRWVIPAILL